MASQIDICNLALKKLGAQRITALTDNVKQARTLSDIYEIERQAELRKYRWSFAMKRALLPALVDKPAWGYGLAFQLPADYISLVQVGQFQTVPALDEYVGRDNAMWSIESGQILTDLGAPLSIRYIRDVTDPSDFDALFAQSFAAHLAYVACEDITGSSTKRDAAAADYKQCIRDAVRINAIERPPSSVYDDSWIIGRL